jgi:hypothetical protein
MKKKKLIKEMEKLLDIQCANGNWNYDPYMHGMANGMLLMLSVVEGGNPRYLDAPKKWLNKEEQYLRKLRKMLKKPTNDN